MTIFWKKNQYYFWKKSIFFQDTSKPVMLVLKMIGIAWAFQICYPFTIYSIHVLICNLIWLIYFIFLCWSAAHQPHGSSALPNVTIIVYEYHFWTFFTGGDIIPEYSETSMKQCLYIHSWIQDQIFYHKTIILLMINGQKFIRHNIFMYHFS